MAKIKKLRVLRPVSLDGATVQTDKNDKIVFRESIVPPGALTELEKQNTLLPKSLKMRFSFVYVDSNTGKVLGEVIGNELDTEPKKTVAELEALIAAAEKEKADVLAGGDTDSDNDPDADGELMDFEFDDEPKTPAKKGGRKKK